MKKSLALVSCLVLTAAFCNLAHADSVPRDRQGMTDNYWSNGDNYPREHTSYTTAPYDRDYYNHDTEARNRGENVTGANMGPAGRNSGFDDNEALHGSSTRHINHTNSDGSDSY